MAIYHDRLDVGQARLKCNTADLGVGVEFAQHLFGYAFQVHQLSLWLLPVCGEQPDDVVRMLDQFVALRQ